MNYYKNIFIIFLLFYNISIYNIKGKESYKTIHSNYKNLSTTLDTTNFGSLELKFLSYYKIDNNIEKKLIKNNIPKDIINKIKYLKNKIIIDKYFYKDSLEKYINDSVFYNKYSDIIINTSKISPDILNNKILINKIDTEIINDSLFIDYVKCGFYKITIFKKKYNKFTLYYEIKKNAKTILNIILLDKKRKELFKKITFNFNKQNNNFKIYQIMHFIEDYFNNKYLYNNISENQINIVYEKILYDSLITPEAKTDSKKSLHVELNPGYQDYIINISFHLSLDHKKNINDNSIGDNLFEDHPKILLTKLSQIEESIKKTNYHKYIYISFAVGSFIHGLIGYIDFRKPNPNKKLPPIPNPPDKLIEKR